MKNAGKITEVQINKFQSDARAFLTKMCCHMTKNFFSFNCFAKCVRSLAPAYSVECTKIHEIQFQKLSFLLVSQKKLRSVVADTAKSECSNLINIVLKESRDECLSFKKETVFQMLLILSHGQTQVKLGFSTNKQYLNSLNGYCRPHEIPQSSATTAEHDAHIDGIS